MAQLFDKQISREYRCNKEIDDKYGADRIECDDCGHGYERHQHIVDQSCAESDDIGKFRIECCDFELFIKQCDKTCVDDEQHPELPQCSRDAETEYFNSVERCE